MDAGGKTMSRVLKTAGDIAGAGLVAPGRMEEIARVAEQYAVSITSEMAGIIDPADPHDPIARQFVPSAAELQTAVGELADPIGDEAHSPVKGVVHRYPDRVLLKPLHVCPVYCRFCFRREMVGPDGLGTLTREELQATFAYIAADPAIWEVILTGGDPLMLSPRRLEEIIAALSGIAHVRVIRLHSRVPVVDPQRVTAPLVSALRGTDRAVYVAVHADHPREFTPAARAAIARLADAGVALIGQSVLLAGVNDDAETLRALMRAMVENRVKPYYLHHPDLAPGTAHFRVPIERGQALAGGLRGHVSGLCQPTYVLDLPGGHGKVPINAANCENAEEGRHRLTDFRGRTHLYPPPPD